MNKKLISTIFSIVVLAIGGYFLFQNLTGNTDAMMTYLEDTEQLTDDYLAISYLEFDGETEEELNEFLSATVIPELEEIVARSKAYSSKIEKEELKEIHEIHNRALALHLQAEQAWLDGLEEESDSLFYESGELYTKFEEELNSLANKWGVTIDWQEVE
ncbi:hypothetical protein [Bacillus alkalicellulosilyticus]|uniref:hypothetical protein n=1 Tax=Alkalihalobacterium alkalicellulosilyticum TaxID=1912214 RepID=UPI000997F91F|nr:hypothetical protein [Bacillus alkalicellulosilyticus]